MLSPEDPVAVEQVLSPSHLWWEAHLRMVLPSAPALSETPFAAFVANECMC